MRVCVLQWLTHCCCCNDTHPACHRPHQLADFSKQQTLLLWHLKERRRSVQAMRLADLFFYILQQHLPVYSMYNGWIVRLPKQNKQKRLLGVYKKKDIDLQELNLTKTKRKCCKIRIGRVAPQFAWTHFNDHLSESNVTLPTVHVISGIAIGSLCLPSSRP